MSKSRPEVILEREEDGGGDTDTESVASLQAGGGVKRSRGRPKGAKNKKRKVPGEAMPRKATHGVSGKWMILAKTPRTPLGQLPLAVPNFRPCILSSAMANLEVDLQRQAAKPVYKDMEAGTASPYYRHVVLHRNVQNEEPLRRIKVYEANNTDPTTPPPYSPGIGKVVLVRKYEADGSESPIKLDMREELASPLLSEIPSFEEVCTKHKAGTAPPTQIDCARLDHRYRSGRIWTLELFHPGKCWNSLLANPLEGDLWRAMEDWSASGRLLGGFMRVVETQNDKEQILKVQLYTAEHFPESLVSLKEKLGLHKLQHLQIRVLKSNLTLSYVDMQEVKHILTRRWGVMKDPSYQILDIETTPELNGKNYAMHVLHTSWSREEFMARINYTSPGYLCPEVERKLETKFSYNDRVYELAEFLPPYNQPFQLSAPAAWDAMMNEHQCLYVWGESRLGKTAWIKSQFPDFCFLKSMKGFKFYDPYRHQGIIIDEFIPDKKLWPIQELFSVTDRDAVQEARILFGVVRIPQHTPIIITSNSDPDNILKVYQDSDAKQQVSVRRRIHGVHVKVPLFQINPDKDPIIIKTSILGDSGEEQFIEGNAYDVAEFVERQPGLQKGETYSELIRAGVVNGNDLQPETRAQEGGGGIFPRSETVHSVSTAESLEIERSTTISSQSSFSGPQKAVSRRLDFDGRRSGMEQEVDQNLSAGSSKSSLGQPLNDK